MSTQRTSVITNASRLYALPLIGVIPIILVLVVAAVYLISGANPAEWVLPIAAMVGFGLFIILILALGIVALTLTERASIARVLKSPLARWPQFATDESWHTAAAAQRDATVKSVAASWIPILIVGIFLGIGLAVVYFTTSSSSSDIGKVTISIALLYFISAAAIIARSILIRLFAGQRYRAQLRQAPPSIYIGQGGIYDEDCGYTSLRWLRDIRYKPRTKNRGARIEFDLFRPATHRTLSQEETYIVSVPNGQEDEAQQLVDLIRTSKRL